MGAAGSKLLTSPPPLGKAPVPCLFLAESALISLNLLIAAPQKLAPASFHVSGSAPHPAVLPKKNKTEHRISSDPDTSGESKQ